MDPVKPIFPESAEAGQEIEFTGAGCRPLPALRGPMPEARVTVRYQLNDEERKALAEGADLMFTVLTYGMSLQPVLPWVCGKCSIDADPVIREILGF